MAGFSLLHIAELVAIEQSFARTPVRETVKVEAGKSITKDISLDVRSMQPRKTYNNPRDTFCVP
jgi:hypothetical protein